MTQPETSTVTVLPTFLSQKLDTDLTPDLAPTFAIASKAAKAYESTIMLLGESGVGKSRLARHIHDNSPRAGKPFRVIDLSQATPSLFESEFFGHEKGSFTGATSHHKSPFEEADGGTVFLDEIGTLSFELQARLLRLVQEKKFKRVGGSNDIKVDVRILVATSRNLEDMVKKGEFREDLYYRLNVIQIHVPPLRERPNDIIPLAEHFLQTASTTDRLPLKRLSPTVQEALLEHSWPGNVRDLENAMKRATILTDGDVIQLSDLSLKGHTGNVFAIRPHATTPAHPLSDLMSTFEQDILSISRYKTFRKIDNFHADLMRALIGSVLLEKDFSRKEAAEKLGTNPNTLNGRIVTYFEAGQGGIDTIKPAIEKWQETRKGPPENPQTESLSNTLLQTGGSENILKLADTVIYEAKVAAVKSALSRSGFVQKAAAATLGIDESTISTFINKNSELKTWVAAEKRKMQTESALTISQTGPS